MILELFILFVGGLGYYGVNKIKLDTENLDGHWLQETSSLTRLAEDTEDTRRILLLGFTMRADTKAFQDNKAQFISLKTTWDNDFTDYNKYLTSTEEKASSEAMRKLFDTYMIDADQVWKLIEAGKEGEALPQLTVKSKVSFEQVITSINAQIDFQKQRKIQAMADAQIAESSVLRLLVILILLGLVVGTILQIVLGQIIRRPLASVMKIAQSVANGNLNVEITDIKNRDEIGLLSRAVNEMISSLKAVIGEVLKQSENVAATSQELSAAAEEATAASEQISDTISRLASDATDQSISVRTTGTVIEQLSANAQQIAANVELVSQSSGKTGQTAESGALQAENAVQKINKLQEVSVQTAESVFNLGDQSKQIGQIVDVIKNIADQTNLLALNAAIEAARAGEQGRGFAVVAEEVRKLAEQSSMSAIQIAALINNIQREAEHTVAMMELGNVEVVSGVEAVNLAGDSFRTIAEEVNTVVEQIRLLTTATQQMASQTTQVVKSVENVGVIAKQSADSAEEISVASEEQAATMVSVSQSSEALAKLGENLMNVVAKFKI